MSAATEALELAPPTRKPTADEMDAILLLVRGGWLRLELTSIPVQREAS